jgi:hypothetical protein
LEVLVKSIRFNKFEIGENGVGNGPENTRKKLA